MTLKAAAAATHRLHASTPSVIGKLSSAAAAREQQRLRSDSSAYEPAPRSAERRSHGNLADP